MIHIKFSKDFKKLEDPKFTTIRIKDKKLNLGETVRILSPSHDFLAEVTGMEKISLGDISLYKIAIDLDLYDEWNKWDKLINGMNKDDYLLNRLNEFYLGITWNTTVYFYTFWAKKNRGE
jgi:hypothetical protein